MTEATPGKRPYAARMDPAARREQLLDAALQLALASTFHEVTMDAVARAAGVTRPVVYTHFAHRDAILAALIDRAGERALAQLAAALPRVPDGDSDIDPDAVLVTGLTAYLTAIRDDPTTWRVVLHPPQGAPQVLQQRVRDEQRLALHSLRELVAWGLRRRGGPALDVDLMARAVLTLAEGAGRLVLTDPARFGVERFAAFATELLAALVAGG